MSIKITIADDHIMLVHGLVTALRQHCHLDVIATCSTGGDLMKELASHQPDILLLDLHLPDCSGRELVTKIRKRYSETRIIILTGMESARNAKELLQLGCMGYLNKINTSSEMLVKSIEEVYAGSTFIEPTVKDQLVSTFIKTDNSYSDKVRLSKREEEILQLIVASHTSPQIAEKLFISHRTVENHRFTLMQKLGVKNAAGLVMRAMQLGIL